MGSFQSPKAMRNGSDPPLAGDLIGDASQAYAAYYLPLVRLARQLVDDLEAAEDVVQDVFIAVTGRRSAKVTDVERYLKVAVVNRARSVLRRRRVVRILRFGLYPTIDDVDHLVRQQTHRAVVAAIRDLPPRQREIVVLRYYEDLSMADIAAMLQISVTAVTSSLSRAMKTLRCSLEGEYS